MAILELEEGRKKALAELISYKATAKHARQRHGEAARRRPPSGRGARCSRVRPATTTRRKTALQREEGVRDRGREDRARQARGRELRDPAQQEPQGVRDQAPDAEAAQGHARDADRGGALGRRRRVRQRLERVGQVRSAPRSGSIRKRSRPRSTRRCAARTPRRAARRKLAALAQTPSSRCRRPDDRAREAQGEDGRRDKAAKQKALEAGSADEAETERRQEVIVTTQIGARADGTPIPTRRSVDAAARSRARRSRCADGRPRRRARPGARRPRTPTTSPMRCGRRGRGSPRSARSSAAPDPLNVLDLAPRQRASDAGHAGRRARDGPAGRPGRGGSGVCAAGRASTAAPGRQAVRSGSPPLSRRRTQSLSDRAVVQLLVTL